MLRARPAPLCGQQTHPGTMTTWPLECSSWVCPSVGICNTLLGTGCFQQVGTQAAWQPPCDCEWKDRRRLKGAAQPRVERALGPGKGQVARTSKDLQMFPGGLAKSKGMLQDLPEGDALGVVLDPLCLRFLGWHRSREGPLWTAAAPPLLVPQGSETSWSAGGWPSQRPSCRMQGGDECWTLRRC